MGACLQVVHTFKQTISGTNPEALAAASGDSLSVPNFVQGSRGWLLEAWAGNSAHACEYQIRSPFFHDNNRGIRLGAMFNPTLSGADGDPQLLLGTYIRQQLYRSDVLVTEVTGTASDNAALAMLQYFENVEGVAQNLRLWTEIEPRIVDMVGIRVSVTAGGSGDYGSTRALNADDARLKANTDYAILGFTGQLPCCTVAFTAIETSGRALGGPLHWDAPRSLGWFVDMSRRYNIPAIPVVNANNAGNTLFKAADPGGAIATALTVLMAELR